MRARFSKKGGVVLTIFFVVIACMAYWHGQQAAQPSPPTAQEAAEIRHETLTIASVTTTLIVATTREERMRGLSGTATLPEDMGMFFVFPADGHHGIWMKQMKYPIDIIWLDSVLKVVHIEEQISPLTFPKTFHPETAARYVLEVPSGFAAHNKIAVGAVATTSLDLPTAH